MPEYQEHAECRRAADRRAETWRAFLYGNFRPRRRLGRRADDEDLLLLDWYEPRVLFIALGVLLLSCTDALLTLNLLDHGAAEANFFMALALDRGIDGFVASKIGLTGISLVLLVAFVRRRFCGACSVETLLRFFFAAYLLVIGYEIYLFEFVFDAHIFSAP